MIYKLGKIGAGEGIALICMLLVPNIYLSEPSLAIGFVGSSAWLLKISSGIVAALLLLGILQCYQGYIAQFHQGELIGFYQFTQELLGGKLAAVLFSIWALLFEVQTILVLREFADYILITTLQSAVLPIIILLLAGCLMVVLFYGLEVILRTAYFLLIIAAIGIIAVVGLASSLFDANNLFPWQGYGLGTVARYSFGDLGSWLSGFAILMIAPNLQKIATIRQAICYGFGYTVLLKILLILAVIMVFGTVIAPERALLFYEMVQAINLSQYLQRVDAIFVMIWLTGGLISALLLQFFALTFFCQTFALCDYKILIPLVTLLSVVMALIPSSIVMVIQLNEFFVYSVASSFIVVNFLIFKAGYFMKCRRKTACIGASK